MAWRRGARERLATRRPRPPVAMSCSVERGRRGRSLVPGSAGRADSSLCAPTTLRRRVGPARSSAVESEAAMPAARHEDPRRRARSRCRRTLAPTSSFSTPSRDGIQLPGQPGAELDPSLTASRRSCSWAPRWRTSAAGGGRLCSWRRRTRHRGSRPPLPRRLDRAGPQARRRSGRAESRTSFEVAGAQHFPGTGYDLVATFDALHDMGDPVGVARHVRESLADDGTWLIVEPAAGDAVADNLHAIGRVLLRVLHFPVRAQRPSQNGGHALGAQAGEAALRDRSPPPPGSRGPAGRRDAVQHRSGGPA